jgi:hypothetical protein
VVEGVVSADQRSWLVARQRRVLEHLLNAVDAR